MKIEIYDTTLRDGAQGAGISFSDDNKREIIVALDELGVSYIEVGNAATPADASILREVSNIELHDATPVVFCATRRPSQTAEADASIRFAAELAIPCVAVVGKSSRYQVENVLLTDPGENLSMIRDTVRYLRSRGKRVFFDAEHFFDGYGDDPTYALEVLRTAYEAGAERLVLCDTNGGMLPDVVGVVVNAVRTRLPDAALGVHCHDDMGMAAACSAEAVISGAVMVQGTVSGIGERCGNCNLSTMIPVLQLKLGFSCIPEDRLASLTRLSRKITEEANLAFDEHSPFVGGYAFTHKAGMHIDAVRKRPRTFEHIAPELVGNSSDLLISGMAGKSAYQAVLDRIAPELHISAGSAEFSAVIAKVREYESRGFQFEGAEASLLLVVLEATGIRPRFFDLLTFRVMISEPMSVNPRSLDAAFIKLAVPDGDSVREEFAAAEGMGPVGALDTALRRALLPSYPSLDDVRLSDYKVRVLDSASETTSSAVRVVIESTDSHTVWRTVGVSADIVDASWQALRDSVEYYLYIRKREENSREH